MDDNTARLFGGPMTASEAYTLYRHGRLTRREWSEIMWAELIGKPETR